jgi:hypothetical protein
MTPQERQMVADLFDRLASLEGERRDPDAERVISEGLGRAPNAVYALVQSVLVQDEALKRANTRIEELEHAAGGATAQGGGGFLDSMRNVLTGRGSVPSVRPGGQGPSGQGSSGQGSSGAWGPRPDAPPPGYPPQGYAPQPGYPPQGYPQAPVGGGMMGGHGGSFLGTAAATVAGVVGGAMLLNGIRSAFGAGGHQAFGGGLGSAPSPWGGGDGGALSRDAGVGDIGRPAHDDLARQDALQDAQQDAQQDLEDDDRADDAADDAADYADDGGGDFGGGGDSDGE